jgi:hypothetical protein
MTENLETAKLRGRAFHDIVRNVTGGLFLYTGGIHLGIVGAGPELYRPFARETLLPFISQAWENVFMARPAAWGLALSLGEAALGVLLLKGGRWAFAGWLGVIAFHLALMLFGWGFWLWSVPMLAILIPAAGQEWRFRTVQTAQV